MCSGVVLEPTGRCYQPGCILLKDIGIFTILRVAGAVGVAVLSGKKKPTGARLEAGFRSVSPDAVTCAYWNNASPLR